MNKTSDFWRVSCLLFSGRYTQNPLSYETWYGGREAKKGGICTKDYTLQTRHFRCPKGGGQKLSLFFLSACAKDYQILEASGKFLDLSSLGACPVRVSGGATFPFLLFLRKKYLEIDGRRWGQLLHGSSESCLVGFATLEQQQKI